MSDANGQEPEVHPPVGVVWEPPKPQQFAIELNINVPAYAVVRRHTITGQVQISELQLDDLISLRDALTEQIDVLEKQFNAWEPL